MRNFDNDDVEKYEKAAKKYLQKLKPNSSSSLPKFTMKNVAFYSSVILGSYLLYRIYDHWVYRKKNYIDIFASKRQVINKTQRMDLWHKITGDRQDVKYAEDNFLKLFDMQFEKIEREVESLQGDGDDIELKEIIISEYRAPKLNLGFFKLHSAQSYMVIDKKGDLVKKTYQIPIKLFGVPFGGKKKQSVKKSSKKTKIEKMIEMKARLELPLVCKPVNYFNTIFKQKQEARKLLFECRNKMEQEQKKYIQRLIKAASTKIPTFDSYKFNI